MHVIDALGMLTEARWVVRSDDMYFIYDTDIEMSDIQLMTCSVQVSEYFYRDENNHWVLESTEKSERSGPEEEQEGAVRITDGDLIRLRHVS